MTAKKTINILSSHATTADGVAFAIDAESGVVVQANVDISGFGPVPYCFNLSEYRDHYGHLDEAIDVLDIGHTSATGEVTPADPDFRMRVMREWYFEAMDHLAKAHDTGAKLLDTHTAQMSREDYLKFDSQLHAIDEFMHRTQFTPYVSPASADEQPQSDT